MKISARLLRSSQLLIDSIKQIRREPRLHRKPYAYLIFEAVFCPTLVFFGWNAFLGHAWQLFLEIWPQHSLSEMGSLGYFVVFLLASFTLLFAALKINGWIHFRALADRIYEDACPSGI
jgi:hypothetical protein